MLADEMGMVTNSSKTVGYCRVGEDMIKKVPDQRQRITCWKPFTIQAREVNNDVTNFTVVSFEFRTKSLQTILNSKNFEFSKTVFTIRFLGREQNFSKISNFYDPLWSIIFTV